MLLQSQINGLVGEIVVRRQELDRMLGVNDKSDDDWDAIGVLEDDIATMEREADRARRWLESCGVRV